MANDSSVEKNGIDVTMKERNKTELVGTQPIPKGTKRTIKDLFASSDKSIKTIPVSSKGDQLQVECFNHETSAIKGDQLR